MALIRILATGVEPPCEKCGEEIPPGTFKVRRPSYKPGLPGTESKGGKSYVWVHERCAPTHTGRHGTGAKKR